MIITLPIEPTEEQKALRALYASDENIRRRADYIHERRMLPPPTCDQCIEAALEESKTANRGIDGRT